ncbi:DUF3237 domain-containing protein [Novosphingobium pentaromativorans]|uniref:UPF0311 protein NSU_1607 n=1 Tax=Novosphingobium pentaromativorans US6-1 TaxID=1088721 RepID=G6EB86_9SPHN|nr:DUF3237 domain-containing protein [Novosphingobium pentaromativorans]EHJ61445.1 hypothetical protein NSU_1607 [Novosphingobium pentaromativorans US6-1]
MQSLVPITDLPPPDMDFANATPPAMEFAFRIRIFFKERIRFEPRTPLGGRVYVPPAGGDIVGPRLNGRVVPYSGADFARGHSDGASELNAHYMLEADDGTPIYVNNRGFLYGRRNDRPFRMSEDVPERQMAPGPDNETQWKVPEDPYFICIPAFDTPTGKHDWLTRHVIIGRGRRVPAPDHTVFDYYVVTG